MTKFSGELITAELSLLCFVSALSVYLLLIRKKKKESAEWVPAAIVRAYLDRVRAEEAEVRFKLFGEASAPVAIQAPLAAALNSVTTVTDPALVKEVEALRAQLSTSDQRAMEFDRMISALRAEKTALEEKLKAAPASASAGEAPAAAAPAEALKELEDLKAKLQEYEVIEDDLANLKKFQKENEQLRQKMEQYEKGGATVVSGAPAQPEVKMVVSGGEEKAAPTMTLVSGGAPAAEAAPAAVAVAAAEPVAAAPAPVSVAAETPSPAPEANTNVLAAETAAAAAPVATAAPEAASVAPAATVVAEAAPAASGEAPATSAAAPAAPAAEEKSAKQKEEELLSEFEKMLAS